MLSHLSSQVSPKTDDVSSFQLSDENFRLTILSAIYLTRYTIHIHLYTMNVEEPIASSSSIPAASSTQEVAQSKNGRTMGKAHKVARAPLRRSYISESIKTPFAKRMEEEQKRQSVKATEREMKDDKEADRQMCVILMLLSGLC